MQQFYLTTVLPKRVSVTRKLITARLYYIVRTDPLCTHATVHKNAALLGSVAEVRSGVVGVEGVADLRVGGGTLPALHVLLVRVLVEPTLRHEECGDGPRRGAHGGCAGRDAAAPALAASVVEHVQRRHRASNALCGTDETLLYSAR